MESRATKTASKSIFFSRYRYEKFFSKASSNSPLSHKPCLSKSWRFNPTEYSKEEQTRLLKIKALMHKVAKNNPRKIQSRSTNRKIIRLQDTTQESLNSTQKSVKLKPLVKQFTVSRTPTFATNCDTSIDIRKLSIRKNYKPRERTESPIRPTRRKKSKLVIEPNRSLIMPVIKNKPQFYAESWVQRRQNISTEGQTHNRAIIKVPYIQALVASRKDSTGYNYDSFG